MAILDHIVIVADSLQQGLDYCEDHLGVRPPKGGEHTKMGTHNHVLNLGDGVYLEVIAVNPSAEAPSRPRWFGLDSPAQRARATAGPFLATFAVRTNDIAAAANTFPKVGAVHPMTRGDLHWRITIPDDGLPVENGTVPTVIQWPEGIEPTRAMPDLGYRFVGLKAYHPEPKVLESIWDTIGLHDGRLSVHACGRDQMPYVDVELVTPQGIRIISGKM